MACLHEPCFCVPENESLRKASSVPMGNSQHLLELLGLLPFSPEDSRSSVPCCFLPWGLYKVACVSVLKCVSSLDVSMVTELGNESPGLSSMVGDDVRPIIRVLVDEEPTWRRQTRGGSLDVIWCQEEALAGLRTPSLLTMDPGDEAEARTDAAPGGREATSSTKSI